MKEIEFEIKKIGRLKYTRLESLYILRKEINSYGYNYTVVDAKELLDCVLNNLLKERFNLKFKLCFDKIIDGTEYIKHEDNTYTNEKNFPDDWIPPIG